MRKLAIFVWGFAVAVVAANRIGSERQIGCLLLELILAFAGIWMFGKREGKGRKRLMLVCAGSIFGLLWTQLYWMIWFSPAKELDDCTVPLQAVVQEYPQKTDYGYSVLVRTEDGIKTLLYTDEQGTVLKPGDRIKTIAHCTTADHSARGEEITYYTAKGIFLWAQAYGTLEVVSEETHFIRYVPAVLSQRLKESIDHVFPAEHAGIVRAVVTGNREQLSDPFTTSLQRTGLSHVVAVSGMHLSCFASALIGIFGRGRRGTALLVMGWAILFCGVAGNTPSISRAAIMILLLQMAPLLRREADGLTSLSFALMVLLLWNPFSIAHIGLQLSFASVAGILLLSERTEAAMKKWFKLGEYPKRRIQIPIFHLIRGMIVGVSTTLGAMAFTVPLTAWHFGSFSLIAPLSNLLTLWAVSLLFVGGMVCTLVGIWLPGMAVWMAKPVVWIASYVHSITGILSDLTFASIPVEESYYRLWLIFAYVIVGIVCLAGTRRRWVLPVCAVAITLMLCICCTVLEFHSGKGCVVVLDVGQGQSVLLRSGNCLTLVDCGGSGTENAGDVAADYLQSKGCSDLDFLVLTHDHADHANGAVSLMERLNVRVLVLPVSNAVSPLRQEILAAAQKQKTDVWLVSENTQIKLPGEDRITLYAPVGESKKQNENGLTVWSQIGTLDTLITGDMGSEEEERLLRRAELPEVELLIAGHHGASTSSSETLLDAVSPKMVVISVGKYNTYGHPSVDVLQRFADRGINVYRTDLNSTVMINVK